MWRPTATLDNLQQRASIIKQIRHFFDQRGVLEVETPLLSHATATDPLLDSFQTTLHSNIKLNNQTLYLQTSPEFAMKRLLAAGVGCLYQITKAFRNGEKGKRHNPEFTILEWYRVGFTHVELMAETDLLLTTILGTAQTESLSYRTLFEQYFNINPHTVTVNDLRRIATNHNIHFHSPQEESKDMWLDLLLSHIIEPNLGLTAPIYIYDYPASQAALARIRKEEDYYVGERFELYYQGIELANGYHELSNAVEQCARFDHDNRIRQQQNLPVIPTDHYLLAALPSLPSCAGVALGVDRLICLALGLTEIESVISFPIDRA